MEKKKILEVRNLSTTFHSERGDLKAIDGVSFHVYKGEISELSENRDVEKV